MAQVAHAADVDVAHRVVVGAREDREEVEVLRGSLHGDRARAQDAAEWHLARFTFKGLDGTMTDLFIHLVAYQLVTLSGTGVSVLD